MKKELLLSLLLILAPIIAFGQVEDDIYYNPKKDNATKISSKYKSKSQSNYISDFQDMDVDTYNNRGYYYTTPIDTIGTEAEVAPDFVYTTQIQKYYNPTIVLDNSDLLADVLSNSYGNINIEYNISGPYFTSWYPTPTYWGYSNNYWNWGWNVGVWFPTWPISWGWNNPFLVPTWYYGWNNPYWGPSWNWGRPLPPPRPNYWHYADYRPGTNRPVNAGSGWANHTRPGGTQNVTSGRPAGIANTRPGANGSLGHSNNGSVTTGRRPGSGAYTSSTRPGGSTSTGSNSTSRPGASHSGSSTRPGGYNSSSSTRPGYNSGSSSSSTRPSYNSGSSSSSTRPSYNSGNSNSGSYSGGRTSGSGGFHSSSPSGSFGGGHSGSGGGRSSGGRR